MRLETAGRIRSANVTEGDLIDAFEDDSGRGEFIILSRSEQVYIQAAGERDGPYVLEYREGGADHHFECAQELSKEDVQSAFMRYLRGDASWRTGFEWKPLESKQTKNKPWWVFW